MAFNSRSRPFAMIGHAASINSLTPSRVTAEILKNFSFNFLARFSSAASRFGSSSASILFAATSCGLSSSSAVVQLQLAANDVEILDRIAAGLPRHVDEMNQHFRAFDVTQELVTQAMAVVRALDQTGDVGHDEVAVAAERHHAEIRCQRGERIIRNLRLGRGDHRNQRGLAGVGKSDQAHIREQLQRQVQFELFTHLTRLHFARRAIRGRREVRVAKPAAPALREEHALAGGGEIGHLIELAALRILPIDQRADGNGDVEILAAASAAQGAGAIAAALRLVVRIELEVHERVAVRIGHRVHRTANAAVAAIGAAARNEFLTAETE